MMTETETDKPETKRKSPQGARCANCGNDIKRGHGYCETCHKASDAWEEQWMKEVKRCEELEKDTKCVECGLLIERGKGYCGNCHVASKENVAEWRQISSDWEQRAQASKKERDEALEDRDDQDKENKELRDELRKRNGILSPSFRFTVSRQVPSSDWKPDPGAPWPTDLQDKPEPYIEIHDGTRLLTMALPEAERLSALIDAFAEAEREHAKEKARRREE